MDIENKNVKIQINKGLLDGKRSDDKGSSWMSNQIAKEFQSKEDEKRASSSIYSDDSEDDLSSPFNELSLQHKLEPEPELRSEPELRVKTKGKEKSARKLSPEIIKVLSFIYKMTEHLTSELNISKELIKKCKWQEGESNLDTDFSNLVKKKADKFISKNRGDDLRIITSIPDLKLQIFYKDKEINDKQIPKKIELKSGKKKRIPGSCINSIDLNEPLIYCYHGKNGDIETRCSLYHQAMLSSDTDLFQDRSPRPQIKFDKMGKNINREYKKKEDVCSYYAKCAVNRSVKKKSTKSWQDLLVNEIIDEFIRNTSIEDFISKKKEISEQDKFKPTLCEPEPELDI